MIALSLGVALAVCVPAVAAGPLLGASYYGALGGVKDAPARLARLSAEGFRLVSFVPTYPYVDRDRIDFTGGPAWRDLENAVATALRRGFTVVLKPQLDPAKYITGYSIPADAGLGGGADADWRGRFELDPMSKDYREGLILRLLEMMAKIPAQGPPVRLELGSELLTSEIRNPERWLELLQFAKERRRALGLDGRVLLSHNFAHHFEIHKDEVDRLTPGARKALARYIQGLDAIALSQYMDLTVAVPAGESRRPTPDEIARALAIHERNFRRDILEGALGIEAAKIPPLHIGEFGVGSGGLKAPNVWAGRGSPEQEKRLAEEIALGYAGLARYLGLANGRRAQSAALWLVGPHYDVFGWDDPADAVPAAAAAARAYLINARSVDRR